jgi:hypothetical protein
MHSQFKTRNFANRSFMVMFTFASLIGVAAVPATAAEDSWTLEVNVSDSCVPSITPASWGPHDFPAYEMGNDVDLTANPAWLPFSVYLGFAPGYDECEMASVDPSGTVQSSFSTTDLELAINSLQCSNDSPCNAGALYTDGSFLIGELDVSGITTEGSKSGSLTVVWTPEG